MITSLNIDNQQKYIQLFTKAFNELVEKNIIEKDSDAYNYYMSKGGRFTSLEEYFSYIEQLRDIDFAYLMLPLDEEHFAIDANSRIIDIPMNFKRFGVGVAGDQLAETLLFKIDRYFDYMDLYETIIYVQWELPNKAQGASKVEMIDIESEPGKILFGWTLTDKVTVEPGKIKFSVRFFKKNSENKIIYSFNTLTQIVTLNDALQIDIQDEPEVESAGDLFKSAITNAPTAIGGKPADEPYFGIPGFDLAMMAFVDNENEITLHAQATVSDAGHINYIWHFVDSNGIEYSFKAIPEIDEDGEEIKEPNTIYGDENYVFSDTFFAFVDEEGNPLKIETPINRENYYIFDETAPTGYSPYMGSFPQADGVTLYERYATLVIKAEDGKSITGKYWVGAKNTAGLNTSREISSEVCNVPAPGKLNFIEDKDLNEKAVIDAETKAVELSVAVDYDYPENTSIIYDWFKKESLEGDSISVGENQSTLEITSDNPGWYNVVVTSKLNNDTRTVTSTECKVTNPPVAPTVSVEGVDANGEKVINATKGDIVTLAVNVEEKTNPLLTEGYSYTWYRIVTDTVEEGKNQLIKIEVTDSDYVSGIDTTTLEIVVNSDDKLIYVCEVSNILNDLKATTTSNAFVIV